MAYDPRNYWNSVAAAMSQRDSGSLLAGYDSPLDRYVRAKFARDFVAVPVAGKDVMEVGSGSGLNLKLLDRGGARSITAVDVSERMLALAKQQMAGSAAALRFLHTDGRSIPLPDSSVDYVFTVTVLQHNTDIAGLEALMTEISRVARERVYLFEDTATTEQGGPAYMIRPAAFYTDFFERSGFRLVEQRVIKMFITQRVFSLFNRLTGLYGKEEGAATSKLLAFLQYPFLPVTVVLDRLVRAESGLTMMVLERKR